MLQRPDTDNKEGLPASHVGMEGAVATLVYCLNGIHKVPANSHVASRNAGRVGASSCLGHGYDCPRFTLDQMTIVKMDVVERGGRVHRSGNPEGLAEGAVERWLVYNQRFLAAVA